jgi:putative membrane protein
VSDEPLPGVQRDDEPAPGEENDETRRDVAGVVDATRRTQLAGERTYLAWWRTALAAFAVSLGIGKVVPELTGGSSLGYEVVGTGYAVLGISLLAYGYYRQRLQEAALREGRFVPFAPRAALVFAVAGIVLGLATIVVVLA